MTGEPWYVKPRLPRGKHRSIKEDPWDGCRGALWADRGLCDATLSLFSLAGGIAMMMMFQGPKWMLVELPLYLVVAWLAGRLEHKRPLLVGI